MIDPVTAIFAAQALTEIAQATGLIRSTAERQMAHLQQDVNALVLAPFYEGLDRVSLAARVESASRQDELLREARSKLHDAASSTRIPEIHRALACLTCAAIAQWQEQLGEAKIWMARALELHDSIAETIASHCQAAVKAAEAAKRPSALWLAGVPMLGAGDYVRRQMRARSRAGQVPSEDQLAELNQQMAATIRVAREIGLKTNGRISKIIVRRRGNHIGAVALLRR